MSLFTHPALLINPVLISAPPVLVLLLILLVPSVLAQPGLRAAAEIEAEVAQEEALIAAQARVREARAKASAKVRGAQLKRLDRDGQYGRRTGKNSRSRSRPTIHRRRYRRYRGG